MEVRETKKVVKSIYQITLKVILNDTEKAKVDRFGPPEIEVGGTFNGFVLPSLKKKIPNEFPYIQKFDGDELSHEIASIRANTWATEMKIRIQNIMAEFKAIPDTFTGENVYVV